MKAMWWGGCLCLCLHLWSGATEASDRRVALLVGNQQGWAGEEYLQHTLTGDLYPLQKALHSVGFEVVLLANQGPSALRRAFRRLSKQKIDTFLFYYSGHAGPRHFHLGVPKGREKPFGYDEFRTALGEQIQSVRRIAIIDACFGSRLLRLFGNRRFRIKGPRRYVRRNLLQAMQPQSGNSRGIQVIVSSQVHAFEDRRRKASIFTYHLLQGLFGTRAADTDQDGKITVAEMFRYAGRHFKRETGEESSFFEYTLKGSTPYGLVPAYNSRLYVHGDVTGKLLVSVGNFSWMRYKPKGIAYRLQVVAGEGEVQLHQDGRCYVQRISLPKGGELRLSGAWTSAQCLPLRAQKKGLVLPARMSALPMEESQWSIALSPGYAFLRSDVRESHLFALSFGARWSGRIGFGLTFATGAPRNLVSTDPSSSDIQMSQLLLRGELGWTFGLHPRVSLWLGGDLKIGLVHQYAASGRGSSIALGGAAQIEFDFVLHDLFGLRIGTHIGPLWSPVSQGSGLSLQAQAFVGAFLRL